MKRFILALLAVASVIGVAACGGNNAVGNTPGNTAAGTGGEPAKKLDKLIISAIPDSDADKLKAKFGDVAKYLEGKIGIPCEYMHVEKYDASVAALATGKAHLVWFGGVTTVQADIQTKGMTEVVCCRDIDKKFTTYFIANADSGIGEVKDLKELAEKVSGKKFAFGAKNSTSGHVMPRHFFTTQAGKTPEDVFGANNVGYTGSHDNTLRDVAAGTWHVGALNYTNYDKASDELKAKAPIIYRTPRYVDYSFCAHKDIGPELIGKIREALTSLKKGTPDGDKILGAFSAGAFEAAEMKDWAGIKAVVESGVDLGS